MVRPALVPPAVVRRLATRCDEQQPRTVVPHQLTPPAVVPPHVVPRQLDPVALRLLALQHENDQLRHELDELRGAGGAESGDARPA